MRTPVRMYLDRTEGPGPCVACGLAVLVMLLPLRLGAQATAPGGNEQPAPFTLRLGAAFGHASTSVSGASSSNDGALLTGLLGFPLSARTDLALDLVVQPFKAQNPARDEAYTTVYALLGVEIGLDARHRVFVRPELGAAFRSWSGTSVSESSETGVALGLVLGYGLPLGRSIGVVLEGAARLSGASELSTGLLSVGASFVFLGARH